MRSLIICFFILAELFFPTVTLAADVGYAGSYSGTFSGGDKGTWTLSISSTGAITGSGVSAKGKSYTLAGQGSPDGSITISSSSGANLIGTSSSATGTISGTWTNASNGNSGVWSGTVIKASQPVNTGSYAFACSNPTLSNTSRASCEEFGPLYERSNACGSMGPDTVVLTSCPTSNLLATCDLPSTESKQFYYQHPTQAENDYWSKDWFSICAMNHGHWSAANIISNITNPKITQPAALIATGSFAEPNDTPAEATPILVNDQPLFQFFTNPSDEDWYEIFAKAGRNYTITIPAASVGRLINPALELYDAAGKLLVNQANSGTTGQGEQIRWTALSDGLFRIRVTNQPSVAGRSPATETYQGEAVDYTYQIRVFLTDAPQQILTKGRVLDDCKQGINGANVSALLGSVLADSTLTNKLGEFGLLLNAGNYELKIAATNYHETSQTVAVGQEATALIPIKLTAATTNACVNNPSTQTQLTPAFYDDRQGLLTIKNIVIDDKAVYYVELKNIGDYRFRLDKFLAIPGVIIDNPPSFSSGTALATLPEVFALTQNWKVQLKYAGNGILTIHSASPH